MIMPGPYRGSAVPTRVVCVAYRSTATQTVELLAPEPRCGVYVLTSSVRDEACSPHERAACDEVTRNKIDVRSMTVYRFARIQYLYST